MEISNENKARILAGERASVVVSPKYFEEGDYTDWQENSEETAAMPYDEYIDWLVKEMEEEYDYIVVYSDGCIYGNKGGLSYAISYHDFDNVETFIELAEEYSIREVEFS